jgi:sugar lactone lactonase YvrE
MSLSRKLTLHVLIALMLFAGVSPVAAFAAKSPPGEPTATLLVTGLEGGSGSTIGPDGALYVTEPLAGQISRVDPRTGEVTTFASGLPQQLAALGIGGVMDVAFIGNTAYALVTLVASDWGGSDVVGIYRVDDPDSFTVVADIGQWSIDNPPDPLICQCFIDTPTGVQYALQTHRGRFLVTDGHHNRVLRVTRDGEITEVIAFGNIVPTGLDVRGNKVYLAQAGPIPHLPEDGKVVSFKPKSSTAKEVASGAPLLVDVEFGRGHRLYALSQGVWDGPFEGTPALPNTGALLKVNRDDGTFTTIVDGLDRPTSFEFIRNTAYVVTIAGEVWKIDNVWAPSNDDDD